MFTSVTAATNEEMFDKVLRWLEYPDPSIDHETARRRHTAEIGRWLIDSDYFNGLQNGEIQSMWLHGVPGAGKTLLFFSAVETAKATFGTNKTKPFAYLYFDFGDPDTEQLSECCSLF